VKRQVTVVRNDEDQKIICRINRKQKIVIQYGSNKILFIYKKGVLILRGGVLYAFHALHDSCLKIHENYFKAARPTLYVLGSGP